MWELDCEEGWAPKNWCFCTVVLEKTLESPLDCMEIPILKEILPGCSLEGLMLKLKLQYFGYLMRRVDSLEMTLMLVRESVPRQVDRESRGPQGERGLEFSRRKEGQTFFSPLHSIGLYNNHVSCLRIVSGKNLLANPVIFRCKLWE